MTFPPNYPYEPPSVKFQTKMYHPNVYENGTLCISILHPPVDDAMSGESLNERWNPTQNIRTVLLSVISLLNEPNISSPANVDASVDFRQWKEGKNSKYEGIVKKQVEDSKKVADEEGIYVPQTVEEYCVKEKPDEFMIGGDDGYYDEYDYACDDFSGDEEEEEDCEEGE
ncbi:hypothetical protein L596_006507 [Steinernema carpocapsae]|uniref:UBC core domain-containing protein n=1 Tax=Steinernema carpocapsae TaxID=34508 RepID=A0A4U8V2D2_STECR|nr:hypothetical protein L596_006506 [Steinernema carpocapsae]TMS40082.1 hypothetical protein L596_006507 [Steinernema carpocapsae]